MCLKEPVSIYGEDPLPSPALHRHGFLEDAGEPFSNTLIVLYDSVIFFLTISIGEFWKRNE